MYDHCPRLTLTSNLYFECTRLPLETKTLLAPRPPTLSIGHHFHQSSIPVAIKAFHQSSIPVAIKAFATSKLFWLVSFLENPSCTGTIMLSTGPILDYNFIWDFSDLLQQTRVVGDTTTEHPRQAKIIATKHRQKYFNTGRKIFVCIPGRVLIV